jgi:hypothetical protein
MREPWQEPKRSGELRGKEIGGLPWKEFVEKYPHLEKKLQGIRVRSPEEDGMESKRRGQGQGKP